MTNIRLSSQQTNSMHKACVSHWAPAGEPARLPASGRTCPLQGPLAFPSCTVTPVSVSLGKNCAWPDPPIQASPRPGGARWGPVGGEGVCEPSHTSVAATSPHPGACHFPQSERRHHGMAVVRESLFDVHPGSEQFTGMLQWISPWCGTKAPL